MCLFILENSLDVIKVVIADVLSTCGNQAYDDKRGSATPDFIVKEST